MKLKKYISEGFLEGSRAPLYHFTTLLNAINIVYMNALGRVEYKDVALFKDPYLVKGSISFTRDKKYKVKGSGSTVVFALNTEKLKNKYKIIPSISSKISTEYPDRPGGKRIEAEERIMGPIKNLETYLINIFIENKSYKELKDTIKKYEEHIKNLKDKQNEKALKVYQNDLDKMMNFLNHKKLKIGLP